MPLFKWFKPINKLKNRGMLIFAAIIVMSFFIGISIIMIKVTGSVKKTSEATSVNIKQYTTVENMLTLIKAKLESISKNSNEQVLGFNWVNNTDLANPVGKSPDITPVIKITPKLSENIVYSDQLKSSHSGASLNIRKAATIKRNQTITKSLSEQDSEQDKEQITLDKTVNLVKSIDEFNNQASLIGGYLVETKGVRIDAKDATQAEYIFKISGYLCDKQSDEEGVCKEASNISTNARQVIVKRRCPKIHGNQLVVAEDPGNDFYHLNCTCPCNPECPLKQYWDKDKKSCKNCIENCIECTNATSCIECEANHQYVEIDDTMFSELKIAQCELCNPDTEYFDTASKTCKQCETGFQLVNGTCVEIKQGCPLKQYWDKDKKSCQNCKEHCINCTNQDDCFACEDNYELQTKYNSATGENLSTCEACNYFEFFDTTDKKCTKCSSVIEGCISCDSATNCTRCEDTKDYNLRNGKCSICPEGCAECTKEKNYLGKEFIKCTACESGYWMPFSTCVKLCDVANCAECGKWSDVRDKCAKCETGYSMKSDDRKYIHSHNNWYTSTCVPCDIDNCILCSDRHYCAQCNSDYNYVAKDGVCVKDCKVEHCDNCYSGQNNSCAVCSPGYRQKIIQPYPDNHKWSYIRTTICEPVCDVKYCQKCDQPGVCTDCIGMYTLYNNSCVQCYVNWCDQCDTTNHCISCNRGYPRTNGLCMICDIPNCAKCDPDNQCIQCDPYIKNAHHYVLKDNQCIWEPM